jgi:hypothetical protein
MAAVAALLLLGACATGTEGRVHRLDELAGTWLGTVSSPMGTQSATLVARPDGSYVATVGQGQMPIQGRLSVADGGLRFQADDGGAGTARVFEKDGALLLRTRRDDGSVTSEFKKAK